MMSNKGLTKLLEECGELSQISAKKIAYIHMDEHPDGQGSMKTRIEDEIADVLAASQFVIEKFGLDQERILERANRKFNIFTEWDERDE